MIAPAAMTRAAPPGLEEVPVSCYSGLFRTWAFENGIMAEHETSEVDDEILPEQREDNSLKTEHYIHRPPARDQ